MNESSQDSLKYFCLSSFAVTWNIFPLEWTSHCRWWHCLTRILSLSFSLKVPSTGAPGLLEYTSLFSFLEQDLPIVREKEFLHPLLYQILHSSSHLFSLGSFLVSNIDSREDFRVFHFLRKRMSTWAFTLYVSLILRKVFQEITLSCSSKDLLSDPCELSKTLFSYLIDWSHSSHFSSSKMCLTFTRLNPSNSGSRSLKSQRRRKWRKHNEKENKMTFLRPRILSLCLSMELRHSTLLFDSQYSILRWFWKASRALRRWSSMVAT